MIGLGIGLRLALPTAPIVGAVVATIHNTSRYSTLPITAVAGFAAAFNPIAARLSAIETAITELQG